MSVRRLSAGVAVTLAALVPASAPAQSTGEFTSGTGVILGLESPTAEVVAQSRSVVTVSGELVVAFEGDPGTCAAAGRCDTRGTVTWRPSRSLNLYLSDVVDRGKRTVHATVFPDDFGGPETISQVRRARVGSGTALCSDAQSTYSGLEAVAIGRQLVFGVPPNSSGVLRSRCGGPLWSDLRYVLPRPRWTIADFRRRGGDADLRTEQTFAAGGLRGTVRSSLVARATPPRRLRPDDGSRVREQTRPYRTHDWDLARVSGSVRIDVHGAQAPSRCEPLDACGLVGSVTLTPQPRDADDHPDASAISSDRPFDGMRLAGGGAWRDGGTASATFTRPDAPAPCTDTVPLEAGSLMLLETRGRVSVTYDPVPGVSSRCAGPVLGGAFEGGGIAAGTVPLRRFLRSRRVTVRLIRGVSRTLEGYRMRSQPDLTIELVRRR